MDVRYTDIGSHVCRNCNRGYKIFWDAPDELWLEIVGEENKGCTLCPECFDELASLKGRPLKWEPKIEGV